MGRLEVLTQSALGTLQQCEEEFRLRYLERLVEPTERPALGIGKAFHAGIEHHDPEAGVQALQASRGTPYSQDEADALVRDCGVVRGMVTGALRRWQDWPAVSEQKFELPVVNPDTGARSTAHLFAGRIDGIWQSRLLELKTTSRLDSDYLRRLDIDFQVTSYLGAASDLLGSPVRTVVYRIARKPSIKQTQKETPCDYAERVERDYAERPDFYFAEAVVTRTEEAMDRWRREVWRHHQRVLELERGSFPVRNTRACLANRRCSYFDLCTGAVTADAYRIAENVHPELEE